MSHAIGKETKGFSDNILWMEFGSQKRFDIAHESMNRKLYVS